MKIRGDEMYNHLCPRHLWQPYASHSNRAWHKLGEIGIAFLGEVEGAEDWVWFAMNVFFNVYPVWSDEDGGWHEGSSYWDELSVPVHLVGRRDARGDGHRRLQEALLLEGRLLRDVPDAAGQERRRLRRPCGGTDRQVQCPADEHSGRPGPESALAMVRRATRRPGRRPTATSASFAANCRRSRPRPPTICRRRASSKERDRPISTATSPTPTQGVQVVFKSSPFGTQSHGYESNNSFLLWAYGERLLIYSGYRDIYGSEHHTNWMWTTRSTNCITVNGKNQKKHTVQAQGRITAFLTTPQIDAVIGDASQVVRAAGRAIQARDPLRQARPRRHLRPPESERAVDLRVLAARRQQVRGARPGEHRHAKRRCRSATSPS